jgi:xylulokinase
MAAHGNEVGDAPEPKLVWLQRERPSLLEAASVAVTAAGFVSARLGASPAINEGDAGSWMAWSRNHRRWDPTLAVGLGVARLLPAVHAAGAVLGSVSEIAASATGIPQGIPIVASTTDVGAAAVAAGVAVPGQVYYSKGTGGFLCLASSPIASPGRLLALPFLQDGSVQLCAATDSLGAAWDWARRLLGDLTSEQGAALADAAVPGANGVVLLPWFQGAQHPLLEPRARATITGLDLRVSRGDVLRSVLESTALMLRLHLRELKAVSGTEIDVIAASGGPTRNELWNRLDAAAARTDILVVDSGAAIGSALIAGEHAGLWASAIAAGSTLAHTGRRIAPEPDLVRLLDRMETAVADVSPAALSWMPALAKYRAEPS